MLSRLVSDVTSRHVTEGSAPRTPPWQVHRCSCCLLPAMRKISTISHSPRARRRGPSRDRLGTLPDEAHARLGQTTYDLLLCSYKASDGAALRFLHELRGMALLHRSSSQATTWIRQQWKLRSMQALPNVCRHRHLTKPR